MQTNNTLLTEESGRSPPFTESTPVHAQTAEPSPDHPGAFTVLQFHPQSNSSRSEIPGIHRNKSWSVQNSARNAVTRKRRSYGPDSRFSSFPADSLRTHIGFQFPLQFPDNFILIIHPGDCPRHALQPIFSAHPSKSPPPFFRHSHRPRALLVLSFPAFAALSKGLRLLSNASGPMPRGVPSTSGSIANSARSWKNRPWPN